MCRELPLECPVKPAGQCEAVRARVGVQVALTVPAFPEVVCTAARAAWHFTDGKPDSWYEVSLQVCPVAPDGRSGTLPSGDAGSLRQNLLAQEADWIPDPCSQEVT